MLEVARGLGALLADGWRPRRSIWLCSWDAEEQGLIGSTEWTEKHADALTEKAVAYLNLDSAVSGDRFEASAVPSLKAFLREVAAATPDPRGGTVLARANERLREELRRGGVPGRPAPTLPGGGGEAQPPASTGWKRYGGPKPTSCPSTTRPTGRKSSITSAASGGSWRCSARKTSSTSRPLNRPPSAWRRRGKTCGKRTAGRPGAGWAR